MSEQPTLPPTLRAVRLLGQGGMGAVWEVEDVRTGQRYACKFVTEFDPDLVLRFRREAQALAQLNHPHVVRVHSAELSGSQPYLVQELLRGGSLADLLERGPLDAPAARRLTRQVAEGVAAAHAQGILHRDLKPDNVLLSKDGVAKVADFGVASVSRTSRSQSLTRTGEILGTPSYMAPEQGIDSHSVDARADVYALGAILYALLTGVPPLQTQGRSLIQALAALQTEPPIDPRELNPHAPPDLVAVCLRALEKDPAARFQSATEFAQALAGEAPARPGHGFWLLLTVPVLLAGLIFGWGLRSEPTPEPAPPLAGEQASSDPKPAEPTDTGKGEFLRGAPRIARGFKLPRSLSNTRVVSAFLPGYVVAVTGNTLTVWDGNSSTTPLHEIKLHGANSANPARVLPISDTELLVCGVGMPVQLLELGGSILEIGPPNVLCLARQGDQLAYGRESGHVGVIGLRTGETLADPLLVKEGYAVHDIVWLNPDRLVVATRKEHDSRAANFPDRNTGSGIALLKNREGKLNRQDVNGEVVGPLALANTNRPQRFVVGTARGRVTCWEVGEFKLPKTPLWALTLLGTVLPACTDLIELESGVFLVAVQGRNRTQNKLVFYDPTNRRKATFPLEDFSPFSIALTADQEYVLLGGLQGRLRLLHVGDTRQEAK